MDPKSEQYKIKFLSQSNAEGFRYFFNDRELLDYLGRTPSGTRVITLEQYDRETNTFQPIK
jgi:hypothetical protein